ncbi:hypothetical protein EG329_000846 [Mollisiaceae sp. DMI_Dod_QoI]|nr:hypothetical protein EG329_000846 [Helotiales sp. DMI_Dod_QoI]
MAAEAPDTHAQTFELFSQLPNELKSQVWSCLLLRRRILQIYYDAQTLSWRICKDSLIPDPISQVNQHIRKNYLRFLDVAILPQRDVILISDPKFCLRPIQKAFLDEHNVQHLQHVSFTADVWQGLRHTNHEFPTATLSPAGVLRKLTALKDFTFAVSEDDNPEFETDSYGYEGEWTEGRADEWDGGFTHDDDNGELDSDDDVEFYQHPQLQEANLAESREIPGRPREAIPLVTNANAELTQADKADRFLRGLEERTLVEMMERSYSRKIGILRWHTAQIDSCLADSFPYFEGDIHLVVGREKAAYPDWEVPVMHIRELEEGEMASKDEGETDWEDVDSENEEEHYVYLDEDEDEDQGMADSDSDDDEVPVYPYNG